MCRGGQRLQSPPQGQPAEMVWRSRQSTSSAATSSPDWFELWSAARDRVALRERIAALGPFTAAEVHFDVSPRGQVAVDTVQRGQAGTLGRGHPLTYLRRTRPRRHPAGGRHRWRSAGPFAGLFAPTAWATREFDSVEFRGRLRFDREVRPLPPRTVPRREGRLATACIPRWDTGSRPDLRVQPHRWALPGTHPQSSRNASLMLSWSSAAVVITTLDARGRMRP